MTDTIDMFPDDPVPSLPDRDVAAAEAAYAREFHQRLPAVLERRKLAQEADTRDVAVNPGDVRRVYYGVRSWSEGVHWYWEYTESVIWERVWDEM